MKYDIRVDGGFTRISGNRAADGTKNKIPGAEADGWRELGPSTTVLATWPSGLALLRHVFGPQESVGRVHVNHTSGYQPIEWHARRGVP